MRGAGRYGPTRTRSQPTGAPFASRSAAWYVPRTSITVWLARVSASGPVSAALRAKASVRSDDPSAARMTRRIAPPSHAGSISPTTGASSGGAPLGRGSLARAERRRDPVSCVLGQLPPCPPRRVERWPEDRLGGEHGLAEDLPDRREHGRVAHEGGRSARQAVRVAVAQRRRLHRRARVDRGLEEGGEEAADGRSVGRRALRKDSLFDLAFARGERGCA